MIPYKHDIVVVSQARGFPVLAQVLDDLKNREGLDLVAMTPGWGESSPLLPGRREPAWILVLRKAVPSFEPGQLLTPQSN